MAKKRIHQIAKELDIASADVLHKAKELGFEVKTASSGLTPEDEELLKLAISEDSSEENIEEENIVETEEEATPEEEEKDSDEDETNDEADNVDINIIEVTEGSTPEEIAIIFDLDGVLVETKDIHFHALNLSIKKILNVNEAISYKDHLNKYDGLPTKEKLKILFGKKLSKKNEKKINS